MASPDRCPACGALLPAQAAQGLCPKCLLQAALEPGESEPVPGQEAPTLAPESDPETHSVGQTTPQRLRYFGDYELLEEIARGGMGIVFKARQVTLNRIVAVKMILAGQLASPAEVQRFHTEAEAAAQLNHPNIVAIHEVGQHDGQHYFSMDYVEGKDLAKVIAGKPMSSVKAAECIKTMAEAVHHAHLRGVLHRDLKPSNVLIDAAGQPRITDFGLAKQTDRRAEVTRTGVGMGTPSYMPPEQATGNRGEVGPASDVYSLGAILYELVTGRPPFQAANPMDTVLQVLEQDPVSPRKLNPQVPPDLETICLKCLEKNPLRRYHSARDLSEELTRFLNHEPILARRASWVRRTWSVTRRRPWLLVGLASLVVLTLLAVSYWLWAENDYLRYTLAHPDYVRTVGTGPMTTQVNDLIGTDFWLIILLGVLTRTFGRRTLQWRRTGQAPRRVRLVTHGLAGCFGAIVGAYSVLRVIDAFVWEGYSLWNLFWPVILAYAGAVIVWEAIRTHERFEFGCGQLELGEDDRLAIRELILQGKPRQATRAYKDRTEVTWSEADAGIGAMSKALRREFPEQFPWIRRNLLFVGSVSNALVMVTLLFLRRTERYGQTRLIHVGLAASASLALVTALIIMRRAQNWLSPAGRYRALILAWGFGLAAIWSVAVLLHLPVLGSIGMFVCFLGFGLVNREGVPWSDAIALTVIPFLLLLLLAALFAHLLHWPDAPI
jgi:tRNA A-37 threonylcarbamoyl transferase component Bud32